MSRVTCHEEPLGGVLTLHVTRHTLHGVLVALTALLTLGATILQAAEVTDAEKATVRRSQEKLNFQLPPDWPIERRAGMVGPVPVEEYLAMKFKALDARLQTIEQQLNGLDLRLRVLEESAKKSASGLKSSESTSTP